MGHTERRHTGGTNAAASLTQVVQLLTEPLCCCDCHRFEQANGKVSLEFERSTAGSGADDRPMPVNTALRLIVARGQTNDINSFSGYHGYVCAEPADAFWVGGDHASCQDAPSSFAPGRGVLDRPESEVTHPFTATQCDWQ
jgi:hypothetical protein